MASLIFSLLQTLTATIVDYLLVNHIIIMQKTKFDNVCFIDVSGYYSNIK